MNVLDLLATENYICYNKELAKEFGIESAILFGAFCGYQRGFRNQEFYREQTKIIEDTCLTEYAIRQAIKVLSAAGLISVVKKGLPAKNYYKINTQNLMMLLRTSGCEIDTTGDNQNTSTCNYETDSSNYKNKNIEINNKNNTKESISNDIQKKTANLDDLLTLPDKSVNVDSPLKENTSQDEVKETATDNLDTTDKYNPLLFLQKSEGLETPHSTQSPSLAPCGKSGEVLDIVSYWKSKEVLSQPRGDVNKWLSGKVRNVKRCNIIEKAIKEYGIENVKIAINRYSIILADDDYYFDTSWGLDIFCKQSNALPDFLDGGSKWESYKKKKGKKIDMNIYPTAQNIDDILDGSYNEKEAQRMLNSSGEHSANILAGNSEKSVSKTRKRYI